MGGSDYAACDALTYWQIHRCGHLDGAIGVTDVALGDPGAGATTAAGVPPRAAQAAITAGCTRTVSAEATLVPAGPMLATSGAASGCTTPSTAQPILRAAVFCAGVMAQPAVKQMVTIANRICLMKALHVVGNRAKDGRADLGGPGPVQAVGRVRPVALR